METKFFHLYSTLLPLYILYISSLIMGLPDSSVGKEFACNAGDPGSIPGSGRSAGEGISQYSGAGQTRQWFQRGPLAGAGEEWGQGQREEPAGDQLEVQARLA